MDIDFNRYYRWDFEPNSKYKIDNILEELPSKAVIFAPEEFELSYGWREGTVPESIDLTIVLGSMNSDYLLDYFNRSVPESAKICLWSTYWFNETYINLKDRLDACLLTKIDKLFISMNSSPKSHRCMMVDELCHANLLKYGHVSWHEPEIKYNWKYWDPVKLVLDHGYDPDVHVHQYSLPVEYGSTVFNLIAESSDRAPFITEKTCTAIFFKKPFIVFGAPGFHQGLKKLGFELYDELFDYSFDIIKDDKLRLYKILQTIDRLKNQDYDMLRQSVIEKTERNYIHAIEIVTSRKYVPEFMLSYLEVLKQNPSLIIHPRDNRYLALGQLFKS